MRQIYEKDQQVVIWLGEEEDNSQLGLNLVPKLLAASEKRTAAGDKRTFMHLQDTGMAATYNLPSRHYGKEFPTFFHVFKRPWFQRGWIVQEASVAKSLMVQCGPCYLSFDDLMRCVTFLVYDLEMAGDIDDEHLVR